MISQRKRFLVRHIGNMGDMIFFVPPVLETLKRIYKGCEITFVTVWGFKEKKWKKEKGKWKFSRHDVWGNRNQGGFSIHLIMTNPHIDYLVHWHSRVSDLEGKICKEDGVSFPTWNASHYEECKRSGDYDAVFELDFGLSTDDNPIQRMYDAIGMPHENYSNYKMYFTDRDIEVASEIMQNFPHPRIALLEGIEGTTTRGWDPEKVEKLKLEIKKKYNIDPIYFGSSQIPMYHGRLLTLRENIATLTFCDVGIGVMSGPMHFAAAAGLPTITLYGDQPIHRAAPAYFLNEYISDRKKNHRTIMGATNMSDMHFLKGETTMVNLTPQEQSIQGFKDWLEPGKQLTKSCISIITVDEVMAVLADVL